MLASAGLQQTAWQHNLPATPGLTSWGTQLTADVIPHTKGAYATLIASTTYDSYGFWLGVAGTAAAATRTDMMIDIALGASQQNVIVPEYLCGWRGTPNLAPLMQFFPIFIPRGAQISARIQALITLDVAQVIIFLNGGTSSTPRPLFSGCDAIGTAIASSIGTSHTPGNTGAESTDASIGSTTAKHYGAIQLGIGGTLAQTTQTNIAYHWELTIGGITIAEWVSQAHTTETISGPWPPTPFLVNVPSGTQLQVQAEGSGTSLAHDVAFYGFF